MLQGAIRAGSIGLPILKGCLKGICDHVICIGNAETLRPLPRVPQKFLACIQSNDLCERFPGEPFNVEAEAAADVDENSAIVRSEELFGRFLVFPKAWK